MFHMKQSGLSLFWDADGEQNRILRFLPVTVSVYTSIFHQGETAGYSVEKEPDVLYNKGPLFPSRFVWGLEEVFYILLTLGNRQALFHEVLGGRQLCFWRLQPEQRPGMALCHMVLSKQS